jgi:SAM-dependent methyltransferase
MQDHGAFVQHERQGWSDTATAEAYADGFALATAQCVPAMVRAVRAGPGMEVLDLCSGSGVVSMGLFEAGASVTGLDFSPVMLELAQRRVPGARFLQGDAMALPFEPASWDAVTIGFGLPHVPDPAAVLAEVKRVLRPGGRVAFSAWRGPKFGGAIPLFGAAVKEHGDPTVALPTGPDAYAMADPENAFSVLKGAGFSDLVFEIVECSLVLEECGALFDQFLNGTVRIGAVLRAQSAERRLAIREAVCRSIRANYGESGPWTIPMPAAVVSARA